MARRGAYPIVLKQLEDGYFVHIPDFDVDTQGESIVDAMEMARDAIGLMGIDLEDDGKCIPAPNSCVFESEKGDIVTLVDVDFAEYRKRVDNRAVKKNCTIPYWLSLRADKEGINYSRVLQDALMNKLNLAK